MPVDREHLLGRLEACLHRITGKPVQLRAVPDACPLADLDQHGVSIDSIQLLELVVLLEDDLGRELDLAEVSDDWLTYTWGRLVDDLLRAAEGAA